jgi:hypothetical protein
VQKESYTFDELVEFLAKIDGKEAEEDAAYFLLGCNIAVATDPELMEKMKKFIEISLGNVSKAVSKATDLLENTIVY